jgi:diketogulonate reductase-like aldo/keto reductase
LCNTATPPPDATSKQQQRKIEFVDFWGTKTSNREEEENVNGLPLPCVPTLDVLDGNLPPGAYHYLGKDDQFDPKRTCRVSLAIDHTISSIQDPNDLVKPLQDCIDSGFQTFQVMGNNNNNNDLMTRLRRQTPSYVETHFVQSLTIPTIVTPKIIREQVLELLAIANADAVDTLLVQYTNNSKEESKYYLDVLDILIDLQRDGWIRSIGLQNFPSFLRKQVQHCGFPFDVIQQEGHLLLPPSSSSKSESVATIPQWWTNPLCHDLLTDRFVDSRTLPPAQWKVVQEWAKQQQKKRNKNTKDLDPLPLFRRDVWEPLKFMAHEKHEVSMTSVALRWALQNQNQNGCSSVVVPMKWSVDPERSRQHTQKFLKDLRKVFTFSLDEEEDMARLEMIRPKPKKKARNDDSSSSEMLQRVLMEQESGAKDIDGIPIELLLQELQEQQSQDDDDDYDGYPEINFGNPTLWL